MCEEMIDSFVERIIYRGNDEFLWVINLSGSAVGSEGKYRISGYDQEYAEHLKSDKDFDIVAQFIIPIEECQQYCEGGIGKEVCTEVLETNGNKDSGLLSERSRECVEECSRDFCIVQSYILCIFHL
ncbi:MAG: hypothetical protein ACI4DW_00630 [Lachnospiraceae bacterium]